MTGSASSSASSSSSCNSSANPGNELNLRLKLTLIWKSEVSASPRRFRTLSFALNGVVTTEGVDVGTGGGLNNVEDEVAWVESLLRKELGWE